MTRVRAAPPDGAAPWGESEERAGVDAPALEPADEPSEAERAEAVLGADRPDPPKAEPTRLAALVAPKLDPAAATPIAAPVAANAGAVASLAPRRGDPAIRLDASSGAFHVSSMSEQTVRNIAKSSLNEISELENFMLV